MVEPQAPPCLLFDYGGTLDSAGITWKDRFRSLYQAEGLDLPSEAFDRIIYDSDDPLVGRMGAADDLDETVRQLVANLERGLAPWLHPDSRRAERVAASFVGATRDALERNRPVLTALKAHYRLGIVSNFYGNLAPVCDDLRLRPLFGAIVDSTEVGWTKPDPRIFAHALRELGVEASEATFVGDSLARDMSGARGIGMAHIWLAADAASDSRACCPGDPVIRSLGDLRGLLL